MVKVILVISILILHKIYWNGPLHLGIPKFVKIVSGDYDLKIFFRNDFMNIVYEYNESNFLYQIDLTS